LNNALYIGEFMNMKNKEKIVIPVPLYHCFGMVIGNLVALNYGGTMIYPSEGFDVEKTI
jgi:fatty-acyl-CoA synthase